MLRVNCSEDMAMSRLKIGNFVLLSVFFVIIVSADPISAQSPPCSNKWMEIGPNVLAPGPILKIGRHKMWVGQKNSRTGMVENWTSYGPFKMVGGIKYLLRVESTGIVGPTANDAVLGQYSSPTADKATIYYQNKYGNGVWVAACTQYIGP